MGSMPRLKIKDEIRYRKGSTNEGVNCKACEHFRMSVPASGDTPENSFRCIVIGLQPGSRYRIRPDFTCERQTMSSSYREFLARMMGKIKPAALEAI